MRDIEVHGLKVSADLLSWVTDAVLDEPREGQSCAEADVSHRDL
jgi:hypothetical protein